MMDVVLFIFFFFNDTATTEIYTLSLHDALPIYVEHALHALRHDALLLLGGLGRGGGAAGGLVAHLHRDHHLVHDDRHGSALRSEEHTSELQSRQYLVCRLLLEKKKKYR